MEQTEAHLLDFSKEFDIDLLDQIVAIAYDGAHPNRSAANDFLVKMKEHPEMWRRADAILEGSKQATSRYFGLQVLDSAISTRWKILPPNRIRNSIISTTRISPATMPMVSSSTSASLSNTCNTNISLF